MTRATWTGVDTPKDRGTEGRQEIHHEIVVIVYKDGNPFAYDHAFVYK
jgi:hypothetical protein